MSSSNTLSGKTALITGGSRGIGAAIALRFGREGADVAISYSSSPDRAAAVVKELEGYGVKAAAFQADQADYGQVTDLIKKVVDKFGKLDILVNNAGVFTTGVVDDPNADIDSFDRQIAINVKGPAAAVRAASQVMGAGGRIISIGSGLASTVPFPGLADYSATKAALALYTRGWARDLGAKGITVNLIQPGPIDTEMNPETSDFAAVQTARIALGRFGRPEEIAGAAAFLAGPDAAFITAATLDVDGGFTA